MTLFPGTAVEDFGERGVGGIMEDGGEGGEVEEGVVGDEGDDEGDVDVSVRERG